MDELIARSTSVGRAKTGSHLHGVEPAPPLAYRRARQQTAAIPGGLTQNEAADLRTDLPCRRMRQSVLSCVAEHTTHVSPRTAG